MGLSRDSREVQIIADKHCLASPILAEPQYSKKGRDAHRWQKPIQSEGYQVVFFSKSIMWVMIRNRERLTQRAEAVAPYGKYKIFFRYFGVGRIALLSP